MELLDIQQQLEEIMDWFDANYEELAESEATYKSKDDLKKVVLASAEIENYSKTQAETQRKALAGSRYKDFLQDLNIARAKYLKLRAQWETKKARYEGLRSLNKNLQ